MTESLAGLAQDIDARIEKLKTVAQLLREVVDPSPAILEDSVAVDETILPPRKPRGGGRRKAKKKAAAPKKAKAGTIDRKERRAQAEALIAQGKSDSEIAASLGMTPGGVGYIRKKMKPAAKGATPARSAAPVSVAASVQQVMDAVRGMLGVCMPIGENFARFRLKGGVEIGREDLLREANKARATDELPPFDAARIRWSVK